jgi:hypothetical protein
MKTAALARAFGSANGNEKAVSLAAALGHWLAETAAPCLSPPTLRLRSPPQ